MQINLEKVLSPEVRRKQYRLVSEVKRAISELEVPEEEKRTMLALGDDYLFGYEHLFNHYHKRREKALASLN